MARRKKTTRKRRSYSMARRRTRTRTVYKTARRSYRRATSGGMKPIIDGALAGIAGNLGSKYLGSWGAPLAYLGVGMFRKNSTISTLGGIQLGAQIGTMIPVLGGGGNGNGGFFQA